MYKRHKLMQALPPWQPGALRLFGAHLLVSGSAHQALSDSIGAGRPSRGRLCDYACGCATLIPRCHKTLLSCRRSLQDFNAKSKRGDGMGDSKQVLLLAP